MLYVWVKALVGVALTANFAAPLYAVASNRKLWEEPMAVLAANMSLTCMCFGVSHTFVALFDLAQLKARALCVTLQHSSFGFGIAFKMAQVCMAADQYVAVAYPLKHYTLMMRARPWLFAATWLTWAAQPTFGLFAAAAGLENHAESLHGKGNGTAALFPECRWETSFSRVYIVLVEVQMMSTSLFTLGLFIHTFVVGHRTKLRLGRELRQADDRNVIPQNDLKFLRNFKVFKKIAMVLSLTVSLDIFTPLVRFYSRWHPMPQLSGFLQQLRVFGFIFEGWAYGLLNAKLRAAYKRTFCGRETAVAILHPANEQQQRNQQRHTIRRQQQQEEQQHGQQRGQQGPPGQQMPPGPRDGNVSPLPILDL